MSDITEHPDPSEIVATLRDGGPSIPLTSETFRQSPSDMFQPFFDVLADLIESQAADLSRLREERDALTEISGVEYCTVHDGIQIEGNSDDCDQADTNPDDECRMVALLHVAPSPDPKDGEQ